MKKKFFSLLLSAAVLTTTPLLAMDCPEEMDATINKIVFWQHPLQLRDAYRFGMTSTANFASFDNKNAWEERAKRLLVKPYSVVPYKDQIFLNVLFPFQDEKQAYLIPQDRFGSFSKYYDEEAFFENAGSCDICYNIKYMDEKFELKTANFDLRHEFIRYTYIDPALAHTEQEKKRREVYDALGENPFPHSMLQPTLQLLSDKGNLAFLWDPNAKGFTTKFTVDYHFPSKRLKLNDWHQWDLENSCYVELSEQGYKDKYGEEGFDPRKKRTCTLVKLSPEDKKRDCYSEIDDLCSQEKYINQLPKDSDDIRKILYALEACGMQHYSTVIEKYSEIASAEGRD